MICVRQISSSTFGCRKNGLPNRNEGANPMPVSAGQVRGRRGPRPALARVREMRLVEACRRERREPVHVGDVDPRRIAFDAVRRRAVRGHVEGLVLFAGVIEVPRGRQVVLRAERRVDLAEQGGVLHRVSDRRAFLLAKPHRKEVQQRQPLAVAVAVDQGFVGAERRRLDRARGIPELTAQVRTLEVPRDPFECKKEERLVLLDGAAYRPSELLAVEVVQRGSVGEISGQRLDPLEVKERAVRLVRAGLGDDVDHAACGAAELGRRSRRDDLELADGFERDVNGSALTASLLAEEAVVVVAAVEADVVEDPALAGETDLVSIGPLDDADAGGECEQILELPPENRAYSQPPSGSACWRRPSASPPPEAGSR